MGLERPLYHGCLVSFQGTWVPGSLFTDDGPSVSLRGQLRVFLQGVMPTAVARGQGWTEHLFSTCSVLRPPSDQPTPSTCANTPGIGITTWHCRSLCTCLSPREPWVTRELGDSWIGDLCPQVQSRGPSHPGTHPAVETRRGHHTVGWHHI